jgi:hypothetical protein
VKGRGIVLSPLLWKEGNELAYTHYKGISLTSDGLAIGQKGSETQLLDPATGHWAFAVPDTDTTWSSYTTASRRLGYFYLERPVAMTTWDGNADTGLRVDVLTNVAHGTSKVGLRAIHAKGRVSSAGTCAWVKTVYIETDIRGTTVDVIGLHVRNAQVGITTNSTAVLVEMGEQGAPSTKHVGIDLFHNDASAVTTPTAMILRGATGCGFKYAIDVQTLGLKAAGATNAGSGILKVVDDDDNCDLDKSCATATKAGVLKVVSGTSVRWIQLFSDTPA